MNLIMAKLKSKTHKNKIFSHSSFAYIISLHIKIIWQLVKEIIKNIRIDTPADTYAWKKIEFIVELLNPFVYNL